MSHRNTTKNRVASVLLALATAASGVALAGASAGVSAGAEGSALARSPWQMHRGTGPIDLPAQVPTNGHPSHYEHISIPAADDSGWTTPPLDDAGKIHLSEASELAHGQCRKQAKFTYFQTVVEVPAGTVVDQFEVTFRQVDDGARAYIFNSAHPAGAFAEGGDIVFRGEPKTANLAGFVVAGETNRVVIVQVDDCPVGNNLIGAELLVNGVVTTESPEVAGTEIVVHEPTVTEPAFVDPIAELANAGTNFKLQTQEHGDQKCLEGNGAASDVHGGASFLDDCRNVTGQIWWVTAAGEGLDGYYRLHTRDRGEGECLEGNQVEDTSRHGGMSFMDTCQNVTGQYWRFVALGDGTYNLVTAFLENEDHCLEANAVPGDRLAGGAANQTICTGGANQIWKIVAL